MADEDEIMDKAEDAFDEGDEEWAGELNFSSFMKAFKANPRFQRKVAILLDVTVDDIKAMETMDLEALFNQLDTDTSGTLSLEEFVHGLVEIRKRRDEMQKVEEEEELEDAYIEAAEAFDDVDFGVDGELDLEGFLNALQDPVTVDKLSAATKIPPAWFESLDEESAVSFFMHIDTDMSGSISFNEWVTAMVQIRKTQMDHEKSEARKELKAAQEVAEETFDNYDADWSGEFEKEEFLKAFKEKPRFVRKVAVAAGCTVQEMEEIDTESLFEFLDKDSSGAISFDEFVQGLMEFRKQREEDQKFEAEMEEEDAVDEAYVEACDAFADMNFSADDELTLDDFKKALLDPEVIRKMSNATSLPEEWFEQYQNDDEMSRALFAEIDTDDSGTISFMEWVTAMVETRRQMHQMDQAAKAEEKATESHVIRLMDAAFDTADAGAGDDGELTFEKFYHAFRHNTGFLDKVATASGLFMEDFACLTKEDLQGFFEQLDTDASGTVSFDEFVKGMVNIRLNRVEGGGDDGEYCANIPTEGPPPWSLPQAIKDLPPVSEHDKERVANVFRSHSNDGWNLVAEAEVVQDVLKELGFAVDSTAAESYLQKAFGGRDNAPGLSLEDCEIIYQVALEALPLQKPRLKQSASAATLTAEDMRSQEKELRRVYSGHADASGKMSADGVKSVLQDIGFKDFSVFTPRLLDTFEAKQQPGLYRFADVADLCNTAMSRMWLASEAPRPRGSLTKKPVTLAPLDPPQAMPSVARTAVSKAAQRREKALSYSRSAGSLRIA